MSSHNGLTEPTLKRLAIGIPTFRRPELLKALLRSIECQEGTESVTVVVVDSEGPGGQGLQAVSEAVTSGVKLTIVARPATERGISAAKNALLSIAFDELRCDALAMIDDDQVLDEHWYRMLVERIWLDDADVVAGSVWPRFASPLPSWAMRISFFHQKRVGCGQREIIIGPNFVIRSQSWERAGRPVFDMQLGFSGGEDRDFSERLKRAGVRFYLYDRMIVHEHYGADRVTRSWAIKRAFRIGSTDSVIVRRYHGVYRGVVRHLAYSVSAGVICLLAMPFAWIVDDAWFMRFVVSFARQCGKVVGCFGVPPEAYGK